MNRLLLPVLPCLCLLAPFARGALAFNIDNIGPDESPGASAGAIGAGDDGTVDVAYSQSPLVIDSQPSATMTLTLTSLTLDANGFDDDSAVLNFTVSAAGGNIDHSTDLGVEGNGLGRINVPSESLTFSYNGGSVTLGAGAAPGSFGVIDFIGFNQVEFSQFNEGPTGDIATLAFGAGFPGNVTTTEFSFVADSADMMVGYAQGDAGNDGFKVNHIRTRFSLDVVPEPSVALTSAFGLTAVLLRRRRQIPGKSHR